MNSYQVLKNQHQNEINSFPMVFAFDQKQFEEGMLKLGLKPTETYKVYRFGGTGGIYRKSDAEALHEMFERHRREMKEAIEQDLTGEGFIFDMFNYELGNHEYNYTRDISDSISSLGFTIEEIRNDQRLLYGLEKACNAQSEWCEKNG